MRQLKIASVRRLLMQRNRKLEAKRPTIVTMRDQRFWGEAQCVVGITAWGADREFRNRVERLKKEPRHD